jgi:hypothetical protein
MAGTGSTRVGHLAPLAKAVYTGGKWQRRVLSGGGEEGSRLAGMPSFLGHVCLSAQKAKPRVVPRKHLGQHPAPPRKVRNYNDRSDEDGLTGGSWGQKK